MKFVFSLASVLLLGLAAVQAQTAQPEELVQRAFAALKEGEEKAYIVLFPDAAQTKSLMQTASAQSRPATENNLDADLAAKAQSKETVAWPDERQLQEQARRSFQMLLKQGEEKGINWREIEFLSASFDSSGKTGSENQRRWALSGLKTANGVVDFRSGEAEYQMNFDGLVYLPSAGGWLGHGFTQIIRKGDRFDVEKPAGQTEAGAAKPAAAPAKPASKTKGKPATTKSKTKTKA